MDSPSERAFDELTALAAHICDTPIALISLLDDKRQWFKAKVGIEIAETTKDISFCAVAIQGSDLLVVPDTLKDERFANNPLVTGGPKIRFYAGAPLITQDGVALGTLCVADVVPRRLQPDQTLTLCILSRHVVTLLELRRSDTLRQRAEEDLRRSHAELERCVEERTRELKKAREAAERAGQTILEIINRVNDGVAAMDKEWRYTYINRKAAGLLGRTPESLIGKCAWDEFPWAVGRPFYNSCQRAMTEQKVIRHEQYFEQWGRWLEGLIYPSAEGVSVFFQDITERKETEETLRQSRAHLGALAAHLQSVREQEATRISRGLHDELGSALTGLKLDVSWIDRKLAKMNWEGVEILRERSRMALELVDSTIANVRKICRDLRPAILDQLGLAPAIAWQAGEFQVRSGITCHMERPDHVTVDPAIGTAVFRIFQEVLTNVARHAEATEVHVQLTEENGELRLEIADDGRGLPPDALTRQDRFGLLGMRERALAVGGTLEFSSAEGGGTKVMLRVPREVRQ